MKSQSKGQIRIIEAFLAVFIVFSALTISAGLTSSRSNMENSGLASLGMQALLQLDSDGSLSAFIEAGNWTELRDALSLLLPTGVSFNLTVYNEEMQPINNEIVSNGGFSSQEITFVEYLCVSRSPAFHYYIIHLHLAVAK